MSTTERMTTDTERLVLYLSVLVVGGCAQRASATSADAKRSREARPCLASEAMISDGETGEHRLNAHAGRNGSWFTFVDRNGSTVTPTAAAQGGTFTMAPGGAHGSEFAAHITGQVVHHDAAYAGMGFDFVERDASYDAAAYEGVSFWAKKGPGSTAQVRVTAPDKYTDPRGKVCEPCSHDFGVDLTLTDDWAQYVVPFRSMRQVEGAGSPRPAAVDTSKIYGLKFQIVEPGAAYDVWVDEVSFSGCPGPA